MDFPDFVPQVVQDYIAGFIDGEAERGIPGQQELLDDAEKALEKITSELGRAIKEGRADGLDYLRQRQQELVARRDELSEDVKCWRRLAWDERMQEVFELLGSETLDDHQWIAFIHSAWAARFDAAKYRDQYAKAAELSKKIGKTSGSLAKLIRQFGDIGLQYGPGEFYSVDALLRDTDSREDREKNLHIWRSVRSHLLGDARQDSPDKEEIRSAVRYIWGVTPSFPELLERLSEVARGFEPAEADPVGAVMLSRKSTQKTAYIRALGSLLLERDFVLSAGLMRAMAAVENVVINDKDATATYDDVRKAINKLLEKSSEDSR